MLSNMASSLILHKRISTTTAKAKALRTFVEPLITKSKEDSTHSRRVVFSYLKDKGAVAELFRDISPKVGERPGGYTRILKTGNRIGDNADMCILELVDYNEAMLGGEAAKTKTTRRRRSPKKKDETTGEVKTPKAVKGKAAKTEKSVTKAEEVPGESEK
jgi:large subunit ribosomal protein L17